MVPSADIETKSDTGDNKKKETEIENVRVVVRVRPLSAKEQSENCENILLANHEENIIALNNPKMPKMQSKAFKFDYIFLENCSQIDIYQKVALPIVEQIFQGYNGTIFAYGQTGSGKTYTMCGNQDEMELKGIIPTTFSHIFSKISRASGEKSFVVTATYLEIYNEEVRDLLSSHPNEKLELRERIDVGVYVKGLTGFTVDSIESINKLMSIGNTNRSTRATLMNNVSSRSHAIFTITIEAKDRDENKTTVAKLNLVDLAGSERLNRTQATGIGLKEAGNINQSLFVLSNVISALVEEKSSHIPYRNSKLTRLLQNSLGGNSKTAMIAAISPAATDYDESLCTLRYASRAKLIKNHIHLNIQTNKGLIEHFEQEILDLQKRLSTISLNEEQAINQQKIKKSKSGDNLERRLEHNKEFSNITALKGDLNKKISSIQNKILIGGENWFDKAEKQKEILESSFEEIQGLDRSHQELQERLEEKEILHFDLQEQNSTLQEEDSSLDERIKKVQTMLKQVRETHENSEQEHSQELMFLLDRNRDLKKELKLTDTIIKSSIAKHQLNKIESNMTWNSDICDFHVNGIAHVGNNMQKPKRRFKKHIPKSALMGLLFHQRRNSLPLSKLVLRQSTIMNVYRDYLSQKQELYDEDGDDSYSKLL